ncbi:MAG: hypothetical protein DMG81_11475 [Acidobacteria bacterium]|nr:MAG: hypothetical protein DMG81_11475 [Acidobacteriota bacterium]
MGFGTVGVETERFSGLRFRIEQIALASQRICQVDVGFQIIRLQPEGQLELGNRIVERALGKQRPAQGGMRFGTGRSKLDRLFESGACGLEVALPESGHSVLIHGIGALRRLLLANPERDEQDKN